VVPAAFPVDVEFVKAAEDVKIQLQQMEEISAPEQSPSSEVVLEFTESARLLGVLSLHHTADQVNVMFSAGTLNARSSVGVERPVSELTYNVCLNIAVKCLPAVDKVISPSPPLVAGHPGVHPHPVQ